MKNRILLEFDIPRTAPLQIWIASAYMQSTSFSISQKAAT